MSTNPQSKKMCKSPPKSAFQPKPMEMRKSEMTGYELLSTNCTMVGSNNLNLESKVGYLTPQAKICPAKGVQRPTVDVGKKREAFMVHSPVIPGNVAKFPATGFPQHAVLSRQATTQVQQVQQPQVTPPPFDHTVRLQPVTAKSPGASFTTQPPIASVNNNMCNMSPSAYSNPSPSYPSAAVSPYNVQISSPANSIAGIKSPVASPQNLRPPTPQPIMQPQTFQQIPVMTSGPMVQIIQAPGMGYGRGAGPGPAGVIKIKPPLNILPKPPPSSGTGKTSVTRTSTGPTTTIQQPAPQIVLPNQAILPTAQTAGTLVLNQMPLIVQQNTAQGVQLILRPGTPTSGQKLAPQNLILQQSPTQQPAVLIQHGQRPGQPVQQPQQLVRVLTANGVIQGLAPAYIMNNIVSNAQPQPQTPVQQPVKTPPMQPGVIAPCVQPQVGTTNIIDQLPPPKRKPKKKKKNKEPKLDLANIMKLSGIGDDDDVHFESDASEPEPKTSPVTTEPEYPKRIGNIHISAVTQDIGKISANTSQTNAILEKHFMQTSMSHVSVQQSLSDISAINQNLTQIGILNSQGQGTFPATGTPNLLNQDSQGLANFLQALSSQNSAFPIVNGPQRTTQTTMNDRIAATTTTRPNPSPVPQPGIIPNQSTQNSAILSGSLPSNVPLASPFNISNPLSNIQVQNFGSQNLFLNQGTNTIIAPNIPNFSGNITINNGLIPNANLTLQNNLVPNFLQTNIVQPEVNGSFNPGVQRTGGFKLALSEDGRLILQHDPNLNQDIQSQLLLQSIFGIQIPGNNLVLTSVSQPTPVAQPQIKPIAVVEPKKQEIASTKTTSIIQNSIPSVRTEMSTVTSSVPPVSQPVPQPVSQPVPQPVPQPIPQPVSQPQPVTQSEPTATTPPNNFSYIVNLTPEQLETLKRNGQLTVNGQTIFMNRPKIDDKFRNNMKPKAIKKKPLNAKTVLQDHLVAKTETKTMTSVATQSTNSNLISALQSPAKNAFEGMPSNVVCVQPNNSKIAPAKPEEPPSPKIPKDKKDDPFLGDNGDINVEQFLNNLNINPTSLGQLISQKLPGGVEHKIVNISAGQAPGQIVAKINIGTEHSTQDHPIPEPIGGGNVLVPPLVIKSESSEIVYNAPPVVAESIQSQIERPMAIGCGDINMFNAESHAVVRAQPVLQPLPQLQPQPQMQLQPQVQLPPQPQVQIQPQPQIQVQPQPQIQPQPQTQIQVQPQPQIQVQPQPQIQVQPQPQIQVQPQPQIQVQPQPLPQIQVQPQPLPQIQVQPQPLPQIQVQPQVQVQPQIQVQPQPQPHLQTQQQSTVYQRIQTIQLTPQKQQLLKNVQLQIQALTARLQQKPNTDQLKSPDRSNVPENEIHRALKLLFVEQQKILATGKIIANIPNIAQTPVCNVDSVPTPSIPVTAPSKNNACLTSLLQQPVSGRLEARTETISLSNLQVPQIPAQKVYYHHGNQIIAINPTNYQQPVSSAAISVSNIVSQSSTTIKIKPPIQTGVVSTPQPILPAKPLEKPQSCPEIKIQPSVTTTVATSPKKPVKPVYSKAQLIEQQMSTDQNGAMNPDILSPFSSKADACKRLVRYHCYNQPILSEKDLNKADEIFELTARHFIEKFRMMVNKYKFLLLKESMREVQTSELMMIDRMFLAEEQQSLLKAQSELKMQNDLDVQQSIESTLQEMYGENPEAVDERDIKPDLFPETIASSNIPPEEFSVKTENLEKNEFDDNHDFNIKCGLNYFSEGSCDSGNFQVYEGSPKFEDFIGSKADFVNQTPEKKDQKTNIESYNTTKIIGNFEIEINNKGCNNQESFTKNFRQKIIDNKDINLHSHIKANERKDEAFENRPPEENDDYDEWLCIQRELGYFPEHGKEAATEKQPESSKDPVEFKPKTEPDIFKKSVQNKRSSSDPNRLETLKKFRVEKHNSKVRKTGGIIGEVKFEVRIEHKKVFPEKKETGTKRPPNFDFTKSDSSDSQNKRICIQNQNHRESFAPFIKEEERPDNVDSETFEKSIDEQVQSAIDSILNLQQITSMSCDKSEGAQVKSGGAEISGRSDGGGDLSDSTFALDEAVKSILS